MKTFHEWLAERTATQSEGLWLNDKLAVPGLSKLKPPKPPKPFTPKPPKPFRPTPPATFKPKPFTPTKLVKPKTMAVRLPIRSHK